MFAARLFDSNAGVREREKSAMEPGGERTGAGAEGDAEEQIGGRATPFAGGPEEIAYGIDEWIGGRRRFEGGLEVERVYVQSGGGGEGPAEDVGVARARGRADGRDGEDAGDQGAERAEDLGEGGLHGVGELGFGAAGGGVERREGDDEGAGGEIGRRGPGIGCGEDNGAFEEELERIGAAGFADGDADTGGEAAERVGEGGGEGGDVVEGEDPIGADEGEEVAG